MAMRIAPSADKLSFFTSSPPMKIPKHAHGMAVIPWKCSPRQKHVNYTTWQLCMHVIPVKTDLAAGLLRWWWGWTAAPDISPGRRQSQPQLRSPCRQPGWCRWTLGWTGGAWSPWGSLVAKEKNNIFSMLICSTGMNLRLYAPFDT